MEVTSLWLDLATLGHLEEAVLMSAQNTILRPLSPIGKSSQLVKTVKNSCKFCVSSSQLTNGLNRNKNLSYIVFSYCSAVARPECLQRLL